MPEPLLNILKLLLIALIYLFLARVLRAVWAEMSARPHGAGGTGSAGGAGGASPGGAGAPATATKPAAAKPAPARAVSGGEHLRVVEPAAARGQKFDLGEELTVGRASGCQVRLADDGTVSQLHARIFRRDGKTYVEDLGSMNGTFLNRKRVSGPVALRRGDRIQVGQTILEVSR